MRVKVKGFGSPQFPPGLGEEGMLRYTEDLLEGRWMKERVEQLQDFSFPSAPKEVWPTSGGIGEDGKGKATPSKAAHLLPIELHPH